jgi:imidazolonepropionase-like amidohydrolase
MLAIRAPRAFDGETIRPEGAVVFIEGSRIVGVEDANIPVPDGVDLLDLPHATVLPGLLNAHVHLCGDSEDGALERLPDFSPDHLRSVIDVALEQQLAAGVTTVRDLGDDRWAVVDRRDRSTASEARPHIVASGPPITSIRGHCWMMGGEVCGVGALRAAVQERAERRVDVVKVMASGGNMTPGTDIAACQFTLDELRCVVVESHEHGLPVTAHAHALAAVEQAIEAGVDGIEHCTCVTADGIDLSDGLLRRLRERQIVVCPTLGRDPAAELSPRLQELLQRLGLTLESRRELVAAAHAAGVRLVSGDDAGITRGKRHGIFAEAVIDLGAGGVSARDALVSATSDVARACGLADRKGRLRAGHDADVLVVDGDATADLTALRSVALVLVGGRVVVDNRPAVPVPTRA